MFKKNSLFLETILGTIFAIVGGALFVPGVVLFLLNIDKTSSDDFVAAVIIGIVGLAFLAGGLCALYAGKVKKIKINRLLRDGECFEAEITNVYPNYYTMINGRNPMVFECYYKDYSGKTYLVKSRGIFIDYWLMKDKGLKAKVYVDRDNPRDYYVDVYIDMGLGGNENMKYDHDFR